MSQTNLPDPDRWDEHASRTFIDYGRYFVPHRQRQLETIVAIIPHFDKPYTVLELCCGEGLLAEAILESHPACTLLGLDGSLEMLRQAMVRLERFGPRFKAGSFDLFDTSWRKAASPIHAIVSSLAIHHLDGAQKRALFKDIFEMLENGGVFIIADVVEPAHPLGWKLAARTWDEDVRAQSLSIDGNLDAFSIFETQHWNMYRYFDPEDIDKPSGLFDQLKWLEQAGFSLVDVYWMQAGHAIFGGVKRQNREQP